MTPETGIGDVNLEREIDSVHGHFAKIFIGGVPSLLNDDGAYLSFICVFAGTEALAGYRYSNIDSNGERFRTFLTEYFEPRFSRFVPQLWELRNSMVHSFSPVHFSLCHHQSQRHFAEGPGGTTILNAEDFYAAFVTAADKYFQHLRASNDVQSLFRRRVIGDGGGLFIDAN